MHAERRRLPDEVTPRSAFTRLRDRGALLLESAARAGDVGRYAWVAADPLFTIEAVVEAGSPVQDGPTVRALHDIRETLATFAAPPDPALPPFQGGLAGYLGYELGAPGERTPVAPRDDYGLPDLRLGVYDVVLAWDHQRGESWIVSTGADPLGCRSPALARERLEAFWTLVTAEDAPGGAPPAGVGAPGFESGEASGTAGIRSNFAPDTYREAVQRVRNYILAGDVFQANLSQRFEVPWRSDPFLLHERLAESHPADFAAYLEVATPGGLVAVASSSPERFLRVTPEGAVESRPIKGTARRSHDPAEDRRIAAALLASEKDRAENVMIVDLIRNDLSRVCEDHSVDVVELCGLRTHPTVHHLESVVRGHLATGRDRVDLLEAAFPGGSITGAPKLRAMEIIAELEPTRRGPYTGSIGYLGFEGGMDLSIAIRTAVVCDEVAYVQAGGGIVLDSDPDAEYEETVAKARGILDAARAAVP